MQHFKFENWKIGGLENSIFDVTNRLFTYLFTFLGLWSTREIETNANKEVYVRTTIRELIIYMIFLVVLTFRKYG